MIFYWVTLVAVEESVPYGFGGAFQWLAALFYADDGLITSPRPARIQAALDVLMEMFDRVGLQTNINKRVGMVCQTCYIFGGRSEAVYTCQMMGVGT